ncbi:MAG: geranylgeranylglycerol-phosphate geranylgeranyltransferase [Methanothrix sp.]|nr:MAG: geranylgeranylglycerol-phosphate geranylgeranyltransferase [Methanothrix sp.]
MTLVLLDILRRGNCLMASAAALIGLLIADPSPEFVTAMLVFLAVFVVTGAGNAINDYFDRDIDKVNRPQRPIPSGRIKPETARAWSLLLFASGCILAFQINLLAVGIGLFNSALLYIYAKNLKGAPLVGNLSVGYLTGSAFLFGGVAGEFPERTVFLFILASLVTVSREIEKDIEDVEGDREDGARTLPIVAGEKTASRLAALFALVAVGLSYVPSLGRAYLGVVAVADLFFLAAATLILQGDATKAQHCLKRGMAVALTAFLIAAVSGYL